MPLFRLDGLVFECGRVEGLEMGEGSCAELGERRRRGQEERREALARLCFECGVGCHYVDADGHFVGGIWLKE